MLKIQKHHHKFSLPKLFGARQLVMSPVSSEKDELIQAIDRENQDHDDDWTLEETPDTQALDKYWNTVECDIAKDPEWIKFADE